MALLFFKTAISFTFGDKPTNGRQFVGFFGLLLTECLLCTLGLSSCFGCHIRNTSLVNTETETFMTLDGLESTL